MTNARGTAARLILLFALVAVAVAAGSTAAAPAAGAPAFRSPAPCGSKSHDRPDIRHVIVIVFENHSYSSVIGPARYLTALGRACGLATNYHAVAHPSLPNYLALTSGSTHGLTSDCIPSQCPIGGLNIFRQLGRRGKQWQAFAESMPGRCSSAATRLYAVRHNPPPYYQTLRSSCQKHDRRLGSTRSGPFKAALGGHLGRYVFVTPNLCNDAHDCPLSVADRWLSQWIPVIRHSQSYGKRHTAIVITFDEGSGNNQVATIVVSPYTRAGTRSSRMFTHYSILHMAESVLGVGYLNHARNAGGFGRAFRLA